MGIWKLPGYGLNQRSSCWPASQPQQGRILNLLSKARDPTCNFMDTSWVRFLTYWAISGTPDPYLLSLSFFFDSPLVYGALGLQGSRARDH